MTLPEQFNDPNDMLVANKANAFSQAWWSARLIHLLVLLMYQIIN